MPKKTCKYCGIVDYNHKCPVITKQKSKDRSSRDDYKIYHTVEWTELREEVLDDCNNICLWSMYVDGEIRVADCVHHIIEVMKNKDIAYDKDNVIALYKDAHDYIHKLYKTKYKEKTRELLRQLKRDWDNGIKLEGLGRYKSLADGWEVK